MLAGVEEPDGGTRRARRHRRLPAAGAGAARRGETLLGFLARRTGVAAPRRETRRGWQRARAADAVRRRARAVPRARRRATSSRGRAKVCARARHRRAARRGAADALRRRGGARLARGAAPRRASTSSASTSRRTISTSTGSTGSSASCRAIDGSIVLVSHDRAFLDRTVTRIVAFEAETRKRHASSPGRTPTYARERALALERQERCVRGLRRGARPLRDRSSARGASRRATGVHARPARRRRRSARRCDRRSAGSSGSRRSRSRGVRGGWSSSSRRARAAATSSRASRGAVVERGDFRLGPIDVDVGWGDRLAIVGPNGAGKTTLLRALIGELPLARGTRTIGTGVVFGELDQRRELFAGDEPLLERFRRESSLAPCRTRGRCSRSSASAARTRCARRSLSPGERSRAVARAAPGARRQLPRPRRADEPPRPRGDRAARGGARRLRGDGAARHARPALPRAVRARRGRSDALAELVA